jgi:molecular chaperone GrpE
MEVNTEDATSRPVSASMDNTQAAPETNEPQADTRAAEIDALKAELATLRAKSSEYLEGWQRARAEFSNYKKRQESDYASQRAMSTSILIAKLLPVLDDFERATKTLAPSLRDMTWIEGVLLIHRKLQLILESEGIKVIDVKANDTFDPSIHEAVSQDEAEGVESGRVIEELQRGYKLGDRVVRPSLVRVAR